MHCKARIDIELKIPINCSAEQIKKLLNDMFGSNIVTIMNVKILKIER